MKTQLCASAILGVALTAAAQTVWVRPELQEQKLIRRVDPVYPPQALWFRITGMVRFQAWIGRDGRVLRLRLISGHPLLVRSARTAVGNWLYKPTAVIVVTEIDVWMAPLPRGHAPPGRSTSL